jgi:hypothetical protein
VSEVLNPVEVEQAIREAANTVAVGVDVVSQRLSAYRDAQRIYDVAEASAYMRATGPVQERKFLAVLACQGEKEALDIAEVAFKYAERKAKAAELTLSAYQTVGKLVMSMYGAAGRGEY